MFAGRVSCCPLVSRDKYADGTGRQTDGRRPLHYVFRYGGGQRNKRQKLTSLQVTVRATES